LKRNKPLKTAGFENCIQHSALSLKSMNGTASAGINNNRSYHCSIQYLHAEETIRMKKIAIGLNYNSVFIGIPGLHGDGNRI
jgi:hypothetical protein